MFGIGTRGEVVAALESKLSSYEAEKKLLADELGLSDAAGIIGLVSSLREQIRQLEQKAPPAVDPETVIDIGSDPRELIARITGFAAKIKTLNGNIGSLEDQLNSLYAEREVLEKELGVSDSKEIITMFRSLDAQLVTMYATRETFERELGISDAAEIVACVKRVAELAGEIEREVSFK